MNELMDIDQKEYMEAGLVLLKLIVASLSNKKYEHDWKSCDAKSGYKLVYNIASFNNVESLSFFGLKEELVPREIYERWEKDVNNTLYRQLNFDLERENIVRELEEKKISYLFLKGILIENYYPQPGMRFMSDNDILYGFVEKKDSGYEIIGNDIDEKEENINLCQKKMIKIMKSLGYKVKDLHGNHDCYMKEPFFNFEMHRDLIPRELNFYDYYKNPWNKAVKVSEDSCEYRLTDEDEYIYFLVHAFKHFDLNGCGIRCIADLHVILENKKNLDRTYIDKELEKFLPEADIGKFERMLLKLDKDAFEKGELDDEDRKNYFYMLASGTYGTLANNINKKLDKYAKNNKSGARKKYIIDRIFVDEEKIKTYYPFFYKHKFMRWLLPFYRLIKGLIIHPGRLASEMKSISSYKKEKSEGK